MRNRRMNTIVPAAVALTLLLSPATALAQPSSAGTDANVQTATSTSVPDRAAPDPALPNGVGPNVAGPEAASPRPGGTVRPQGQIVGAAYTLNTNPDGTVTRWDPCKTIHYQVNLTAKPDALADIQEAVRQASAASGLQFVYDGTSSEIPQGQGTHAGSPLLISWANPQPGQPSYSDMLGTDPGVLGIGGWGSRMWTDGSGTHPWQIVSGFVVMSATATMNPGSGASNQASRVRALMHELGHAVGLNHTQDAAQVMYPYIDGRAAAWGPGDLQGLGLVGAPAGCIDPGATQAPAFTAAAPPQATAGVPYSYRFTASGSPAPRFTVTTGTLPPGLTLDANTGVLAGTPTAPGTTTFRVTAANGIGTAAVTPSLTITVAPAVTPNTPAASAIPGVAEAGGVVGVTLNGWAPNSALSVTLDGSGRNYPVTTDANGSAIAVINVPSGLVPGPHAVVVRGAGSSVSAPFVSTPEVPWSIYQLLSAVLRFFFGI